MLVTSREVNADGWWTLRKDLLVDLRGLMKVERSMKRGGWLEVILVSGNIEDGVRTSGVQSLTGFNDGTDNRRNKEPWY